MLRVCTKSSCSITVLSIHILYIQTHIQACMFVFASKHNLHAAGQLSSIKPLFVSHSFTEVQNAHNSWSFLHLLRTCSYSDLLNTSSSKYVYILRKTFRIFNCSLSLPVMRCSTPKSISNADTITLSAIDDDTARLDASVLSVQIYVWYESTAMHFASLLDE